MLENSQQVKDDHKVETFGKWVQGSLSRIPSVAEIQKAFFRHTHTRYDLLLPNIYINNQSSEMDLVGLRTHGFLDEIEIKVSHADFMADFRKKVTVQVHDESVEMPKHQAITSGLLMPNYFSFLISQEMFNSKPEVYTGKHYGLYIYRVDANNIVRVQEVKKAPVLHRRKVNMLTRYNIARKFQYKFWRHIE